ncbi:hypothetical protein [Prauserella shujinwangii]|nr:hypothetical protein [Prauserella shujinwangii]
MTECPFCGWPDADPFAVLSRHRTVVGETVWTRCACGSLQVREIGVAGMRITTRGRPGRGPAWCEPGA